MGRFKGGLRCKDDSTVYFLQKLIRDVIKYRTF